MTAHQYFRSRTQDAAIPLDDRIRTAILDMMRPCGVADDPKKVQHQFDREFNRTVGVKVVSGLEKRGIVFNGARVLDLGAGLGTLSIEAALRGARVAAVEPGEQSCALLDDRIAAAGLSHRCEAVRANGEQLPFNDNEFDVIMSHQVLEHVQHPLPFLREAFRVLKPGGYLNLSCENYLRPYEPHYEIFWLPMLPKPIGALYLRARGKPTDFLRHSIFYTTTPGVLRMMRRCGFVDSDVPRVRKKLGRLSALAEIYVWTQHMRGAFTDPTAVLMRKPALPASPR